VFIRDPIYTNLDKYRKEDKKEKSVFVVHDCGNSP
jgi:hypothetical protein